MHNPLVLLPCYSVHQPPLVLLHPPSFQPLPVSTHLDISPCFMKPFYLCDTAMLWCILFCQCRNTIRFKVHTVCCVQGCPQYFGSQSELKWGLIETSDPMHGHSQNSSEFENSPVGTRDGAAKCVSESQCHQQPPAVLLSWPADVRGQDAVVRPCPPLLTPTQPLDCCRCSCVYRQQG